MIAPLFKFIRAPKPNGISIVEIMVAMAIFSTAMIGLYFAMNNLSISVGTAMKRDIESAYANMLLSQINPYDLQVESAYDKDSTEASCGGGRCSVTLPNGDQFWYTIQVDSATTAADIKRVNLYLYRNGTTTTPYRQFRREFPMAVQAYAFGSTSNSSKSYYKDSTGQVWTLINTTHPVFSATTGAVRAGRDSAYTNTSSDFQAITTATVPTPSLDPILWQNAYESHGGTNTLGFIFPASANHTYTIVLGFNEIEGAAATTRVFDIYINDEKVASSFDINAQAGGAHKTISQYYTAVPITHSGIPVNKVRLVKVSGANGPIISNIKIIRN